MLCTVLLLFPICFRAQLYAHHWPYVTCLGLLELAWSYADRSASVVSDLAHRFDNQALLVQIILLLSYSYLPKLVQIPAAAGAACAGAPTGPAPIGLPAPGAISPPSGGCSAGSATDSRSAAIPPGLIPTFLNEGSPAGA